MKSDVLAICGAFLVVAGVFCIYPPAGLIACGMALVCASIATARRVGG